MIEFIYKEIELKKNLKKHKFDDKQNFRFDTEDSNKSTLYRILLNNIKEAFI